MANSRLSNIQRIQRTLQCVPRGKVASYGQIADLAGLPGRARLVGKVLRESPADLHLPWHRILRASGQLAFDAHSTQADRQAELLAMEQVEVIQNRVDLKQHAWQPSLADILFRLEQ